MKHPTPEMTHCIPHRRGVSCGRSASGTWSVGSIRASVPGAQSGTPASGLREELCASPGHERKASVTLQDASDPT